MNFKFSNAIISAIISFILVLCFAVSCERKEGPEGKQSLIDFISESAGSNCSSGGYKITTGIDLNSNGILEEQEIQNTKYICHGDDGRKSLMSVITESPGKNCQAGGYRILAGIDLNSNSILDSIEVQHTEFICHGDDGHNSISSVFPEEAGENCPFGGIKIITGVDFNDNSILDSSEVDYTEYICNDGDIELKHDSIIIQPDGDIGKDAFLFDMHPQQNFGNSHDFAAMAWTNSGIPVTVRGLIEFDLSEIPAKAIIDSAYLSLYSYDSPSNGSHSTLSGTNASLLFRVIADWSESTVTWDNQPLTSDENIVFLPASTESIQHYLNINVTNLIKDATSETTKSFGMMIKLVEEEYYRSLVFASSDYENSELHPSLCVFYSMKEDNN